MSYEIYSSPNKIGQKILRNAIFAFAKMETKNVVKSTWKYETATLNTCDLSTGIIYICSYPQSCDTIPLNIADYFYMQTMIC